jgi:hypothetical protein
VPNNSDLPTIDARVAPPGVDAVEIKVTLGADQVDAGLAAFALDPAPVERRQIWFCERIDEYIRSDELPLLARGLIVRVRKRKDHSDDATLKLRGPEGCIDPALWHRRTSRLGEQARIEGDWTGDRHLVSASLDSDVEGGRIDEVFAGRPHQAQRLFSKAQAALAEAWLLRFRGLQLLGPIEARKWEAGAGRLEQDIAAELWEVDDRLRFLEFSIRVGVEQDQVAEQRRLEATLGDHELRVDPEQKTKTRLVLQRLAEAAGAQPPGRNGTVS